MGLFSSLFGTFLITPESVGEKGERMIAARLGWIDFLGYQGIILQNIYVPKSNDETTEIDLLYIRKKEFLLLKVKIIPAIFLEVRKVLSGPKVILIKEELRSENFIIQYGKTKLI